MAQVPFTDFILGGLADSEFYGQKNSMYELVGLDLHSQPGKVLVNQKLTKDSPANPDEDEVNELCKVGLSVSDGSTLWFSSTSGKIWRELAGAWELMYTVVIAAGDLLTASLFGNEDVSAQENHPGIRMKGDGTTFLMVGLSEQLAHEFDLGTAKNITTASFVDSYDFGAETTNSTSIFVSSDGLTMYISSSNTIYQYTLGTAWDVSTASYASKSFSTNTQTSTNMYDFWIGNSGTKLYALVQGGTVYQYTLGTPWDISTASYDSVSFLKSEGLGSANYAMALNATGTKAYLSSGDAKIYQYTLATPWNIGTATYDNKSLTLPTGKRAFSITLDSTETNMYVGVVNDGLIYQYTLDDGTTESKILGAEEYVDEVYFATEKYLLKIDVADLGSTWSSHIEVAGTFTNGDDTYHPMKKLNGILYIGDRNFVAQVEEGVFTADALDIVEPLRISALGAYDVELLIGTYVSSNVMQTEFLRWNTWSDSWQYSDPIPEPGINAFLSTDNEIVVSAGTRGHIYTYDGLQLQSRKRLPGTFTRGTTDKCRVYPYSVLNYEGIPLFGVSQESGNAIKYGVYSYAKRSAGYPGIFALEYVISPNTMQDIQIGAIVGNGDVFMVAWKSGSSYGVDRLDTSAKYTGAYMSTRWIIADRREPLNFGQVDVAYALLPDNCDITIAKQFDAETTFGSALTAVTDSVRMLKSTKEALGDAVKAKIKIGFTVSGNTAPEIEGFYVDVEAGDGGDG